MADYEMWPYHRKPDEIVSLWRARQAAQSPVIRVMQAVQRQYNGDIVVPLPELDKNEQAAVANLLQQGLDNYGARIASVPPDLTCPPVNPRKPTSVKLAEKRRRATLGWWESNRINLQLRRRSRHYVGYGMQAVTLRPDFAKGFARWELRNPLGAFPAPCHNPDDITPSDTIFVTERSLGFIRRNWPDKATQIADRDQSDDEQFCLLEYDDPEQVTLLAVQTAPSGRSYSYDQSGKSEYVVLETQPNLAGCPLSVVAGRITLDRPAGQFDGILGMYQAQAKLMALEVLAVQKGVFPDKYLLSRPNETARFTSGPHPNGSGRVNIVEGGDVNYLAPNPSFAVNQTIDRLERSQKQTGGIPSDFSGESNTNVRTGRRGDSLLSAVVDFPIQEAQEVLSACLEEENYRACRIAQSWFKDRPVSFHVQWKGAKGQVDYTAAEFDSCYSNVNYPMAGSDINNYVVGGGQRVGLGTMSKQTFMKLDPYIDDPELEADQVTAEGLEAALLQGIQNMAAGGQLPPADLARIIMLVKQENMDLADAVDKVHEEAQKRQANAGPPGTPEAGVEPGAPEAQPGLAVPGAGAEAGVSVPPTTPSMNNLNDLLMSLRAG